MQQKKVLLNRDVCTENKLKELLTFSFKPANADHKNSDHKTKRIRVQTEKIKERKMVHSYLINITVVSCKCSFNIHVRC